MITMPKFLSGTKNVVRLLIEIGSSSLPENVFFFLSVNSTRDVYSVGEKWFTPEWPPALGATLALRTNATTET